MTCLPIGNSPTAERDTRTSSSADPSPKLPPPPAPRRPGIAAEWALDPSITFLNHGSFGARPRAVLAAQTARREAFEASPIEWLDRKRHEMIATAKESIADFLGFTPANVGFVTNATGAINAVLRSRRFGPGDELLTTTHVYNAVRQTMRYLAEQAGGRHVEADVPLPLRSPDEVVDAIEKAMTPRTRFLVVDHITSPTAVIFPIERLIELCAARGVEIMIDGAHAPGMIPLQIERLNPDFYTGNLHKWMCAPPGAALLWARPDQQTGIHPTTISHFLGQGLVTEFNWQGTRDITPWLCVSDAMQYMGSLPGGWSAVMTHNHALAAWVQAMLCDAWGVEPSSPPDGSMIGSMTTVLLPRQEQLRAKHETAVKLKAQLFDQYRIEVPVVDWGGRWWVRPCCQVYNRAELYEKLAAAVKELAGMS